MHRHRALWHAKPMDRSVQPPYWNFLTALCTKTYMHEWLKLKLSMNPPHFHDLLNPNDRNYVALQEQDHVTSGGQSVTTPRSTDIGYHACLCKCCCVWSRAGLVRCLRCGKPNSAIAPNSTAAFCLHSDHWGMAYTSDIHSHTKISSLYGLKCLHSKLPHDCIQKSTTRRLIFSTMACYKKFIPQSFPFSISSTISWQGHGCSTSYKCYRGCTSTKVGIPMQR
jgi:hypothetical protein